MQLVKLLAPLLAFVASTTAFKYKNIRSSTSDVKDILFLNIRTAPPDVNYGRNIQLRPNGNDLDAVIDSTSQVALISLHNSSLQLQGIRGHKLVNLKYFAGLRNVETIDGGKTTVKEVYFSRDPQHGKQKFELYYDPGSGGVYFLVHYAKLPKGAHRAAFGFALCPRNGGDYYQLSFVVSVGKTLKVPKGCSKIGAYTTIGPTPAQLGNSGAASEASLSDVSSTWLTTHA